jgi:hypothetical protein
MKSLVLLCLLASPVFAQDICGMFPPQEFTFPAPFPPELKIVYPGTWEEQPVTEMKTLKSKVPMKGMKLRYEGQDGLLHEIWVLHTTKGQKIEFW